MFVEGGEGAVTLYMYVGTYTISLAMFWQHFVFWCLALFVKN